MLHMAVIIVYYYTTTCYRNIAALGVSECLVLGQVSSTQIELIRCKELESPISIDLGNFISAHAERIQAL